MITTLFTSIELTKSCQIRMIPRLLKHCPQEAVSLRQRGFFSYFPPAGIFLISWSWSNVSSSWRPTDPDEKIGREEFFLHFIHLRVPHSIESPFTDTMFAHTENMFRYFSSLSSCHKLSNVNCWIDDLARLFPFVHLIDTHTGLA